MMQQVTRRLKRVVLVMDLQERPAGWQGRRSSAM